MTQRNGSNGHETILIVDDAPDTLELLNRNLSAYGYRVFQAKNVADAISLLESTEIDLVITDYKMPGVDGIDLIRYVSENFKEIEVLMVTGYPSIKLAVEAIKTGADNYLAKPFTKEELFAAVNNALQKLHQRRLGKNGFSPELSSFRGLVGESDAIKKVFDSIVKAARTTATVLVIGESGTGKELVARAVHYNSKRSSARSFR